MVNLNKENFNNYVKNYSYEEGNRKTLASGSVTKLFFNSKSQNLLIASRGDGMFSLSLKDSLFTNFTVGDGLLSNNIYDFMKKDELVWVQTGNGVNSINNKKLQDALILFMVAKLILKRKPKPL